MTPADIISLWEWAKPFAKPFAIGIGIIVFMVRFAAWIDSNNDRDRQRFYSNLDTDDTKAVLLLHIRQDVALLCHLLTALIGVVLIAVLTK
jgi:hypothetical protein